MEEDVVVMSRQAFQQRRARVQKQLQEITTIREAPKKQEEGGEEEENKYNYRALLAEGHSLCLDAEVAHAKTYVKNQVLQYVAKIWRLAQKFMSYYVNNNDDGGGRGGGDELCCRRLEENREWNSIKAEGGAKFGLRTQAFDALKLSISRSVALDNTKLERAIISMLFKCDDELGNPVKQVGNEREEEAFAQQVLVDAPRCFTLCTPPLQRLQDISSSCLISDQAFVLSDDTTIAVDSPSLLLPLQWISHNYQDLEFLRTKWQQDFRGLGSLQAVTCISNKKSIDVVVHCGAGLCDSRKQFELSDRITDLESEEEEEEEEDGDEQQEDLEEDDADDDDDEEEEVWESHEQVMQVGENACSVDRELSRELLVQMGNCTRDQAALCHMLTLDLTQKGLTSLGDRSFSCWCPRIHALILDKNSLTTLENAFHGCQEFLEHISAKDNFLTDFAGLETLHNLQVLSLEGNAISQILACTKEPCWDDDHDNDANHRLLFLHRRRGLQFESLQCSRCVDNVGRLLLQPWWPNLKNLSLGRNRVTEIFNLGFVCPNLEILDLSANQLVSLGGDAKGSGLTNLRNLRVLDVGQNRLKGRSLWEALNHCPLLVSLVASRNRLTELPTHSGNALLQELWLNGNSIRYFSCKAWLPNLQRLYLQDNNIDTLVPTWGCPSLEASKQPKFSFSLSSSSAPSSSPDPNLWC
jgi:Leucine-rich repeat (LRR) protein